MTKAFADGVELSKGEKYDEAVSKFNEVIAAIPNCAECYANIGTVQTNASPGSHYQETPLTAAHAQIARVALVEVLEWFRGVG